MKWVDGSEIDPKEFSGEELCEKLAGEMWDCREKWNECAEFIQNALRIIDFDTVICMEGFSTPYNNYFSAEEYSKIIEAFQAIGDNNDADILTEASKLDIHYQNLLNSAKNKNDKNEFDKIYYEFSEKIDELGNKIYINKNFDIWNLLYRYLDKQISEM
ncbi:MAG: hypothetical protein IJ736_16735 [Firmicutes bacterium]|nr:hypothetical protein [Bacillota bacterium]